MLSRSVVKVVVPHLDIAVLDRLSVQLIILLVRVAHRVRLAAK